jgi:hypothetical protein
VAPSATSGTSDQKPVAPSASGASGTRCHSTKDNINPITKEKEKYKKEKEAIPIREEAPIDPDFKPTDQDYDLLARKKIPRGFIDQQIPEFIAYWQEVGKVARDWRAKFRNRVTDLHLRVVSSTTVETPGHEQDFSSVKSSRGILDEIS